MNKNHYLKLFSSFLVGLIFGVILIDKGESQYLIIKKWVYKRLSLTLLSIVDYKFEKCLPEIIEKVPNQSSVIIGHSYGSKRGKVHWKKYDNFAPHVDKFLNTNVKRISNVIFTGDVFFIPSEKDWDELYKKYEPFFNIYIAPGEHDVGREKENAYRDVFNRKVGLKQPSLPFMIHKENFDIIIDDSNDEQNFIPIIKNLRSNKKNDHLLIMRHHVAIEPLVKYGNSRQRNRIFDEKFLEDLFPSYKNVTIINGNGGAYETKPRIACYRHNNINHIVNGIGDLSKDKVIVINDGAIYQYNLSKYFN